ncbi:hypothetical protein DFQ29_004833 [Apophysomyces sp. BC1021]|nr:hypothetical protein DFQ29_004833 [Apophysomyces sp. BC1021]
MSKTERVTCGLIFDNDGYEIHWESCFNATLGSTISTEPLPVQRDMDIDSTSYHNYGFDAEINDDEGDADVPCGSNFDDNDDWLIDETSEVDTLEHPAVISSKPLDFIVPETRLTWELKKIADLYQLAQENGITRNAYEQLVKFLNQTIVDTQFSKLDSFNV